MTHYSLRVKDLAGIGAAILGLVVAFGGATILAQAMMEGHRSAAWLWTLVLVIALGILVVVFGVDSTIKRVERGGMVRVECPSCEQAIWVYPSGWDVSICPQCGEGYEVYDGQARPAGENVTRLHL